MTLARSQTILLPKLTGILVKEMVEEWDCASMRRVWAEELSEKEV